MSKFTDAIQIWFASASRVITRCVIRFALFVITVVGAAFPATYAADVQLSFDPYSICKSVDHAGLFRDLIYIVVALSLISICEILYAFATKGMKNTILIGAYIVGCAYMIYILIFGIGEFAHLANQSDAKYVLGDVRLHYDFEVIASTCIVALLIEMVLAFQGE